MSSLINKVKDKLHSDNKTEQPEGTHGHHTSRAANAADPRIDSDRDHRDNLGRHEGTYTTGGDNYSYGDSTTHGTTGTTGITGTTGSTTGTSGTGGTYGSSRGTEFGSTGATGPGSNTAGVHKSDALNKADPRIDSDLDGSRNMGLHSSRATAGTGTGTGTGIGTTRNTRTTGTTGTTMGTGTSGTAMGTGVGSGIGSDTRTGTDTFSSGGVTGNTGSTGAYSSGMDTTSGFSSGDRHLGQQTGTLGTDTSSSAYGGGMGSVGGGFGSTRQATGPADNTAGPHKSDMLNKADPRVDSDLDHSKTFGGDKTFTQS
ncbi:hypothetical protein V8C37DRAFT_366159 [Trichoderma ceciliae]